MGELDRRDEQRHSHDDTELWNESYYLDWFNDDLSIGGYVRIGFYPNLDRVWYWACLVGPDRRLVSVVEHDIPMPRSGSSLDVRYDGLWADHVVETPGEHMSINLESFALVVDDPTEMYRSEPRGERVPFGFELDFETDRASYMWPDVTPRYEIPCRVHGTVQLGKETVRVDGWGQRDHSWGHARDWWSIGWSWTAGRLDDGTRFHSTGGFFPDDDWGVAYLLAPDSTDFCEYDSVRIGSDEGAEGLPIRTVTAFGDLDLDFRPAAYAPVLLTHPDGRQSRFPRALCRVVTADGRSGGAWVEWNQPPNRTVPQFRPIVERA